MPLLLFETIVQVTSFSPLVSGLPLASVAIMENLEVAPVPDILVWTLETFDLPLAHKSSMMSLPGFGDEIGVPPDGERDCCSQGKSLLGS